MSACWMKLIIKKQWQVSKREKVDGKKMWTCWWKQRDDEKGEHEKQVWHAFDEPAVRPQLLYGSHNFNQRFIVFQTAIDYGYAAPHFLPQKQTASRRSKQAPPTQRT